MNLSKCFTRFIFSPPYFQQVLFFYNFLLTYPQVNAESSVILRQHYMEFISLKVDLWLFTLFNTKKLL